MDIGNQFKNSHKILLKFYPMFFLYSEKYKIIAEKCAHGMGNGF